jgi:hypothetical protein
MDRTMPAKYLFTSMKHKGIQKGFYAMPKLYILPDVPSRACLS